LEFCDGDAGMNSQNDARTRPSKHTRICPLVYTQYRQWTDRQTDRQTDGFTIAISRSVCIACWRAIKTSGQKLRL